MIPTLYGERPRNTEQAALAASPKHYRFCKIHKRLIEGGVGLCPTCQQETGVQAFRKIMDKKPLGWYSRDSDLLALNAAVALAGDSLRVPQSENCDAGVRS